MNINPNKLKFADSCAYHALAGVMPLSEAERAYHAGRLDARDFRAYRLAWEWCVPRFSSVAQDRAWDALGRDAYLRRMERAKRLLARYVAKRFAYAAAP